jgi:hypothetical protein
MNPEAAIEVLKCKIAHARMDINFIAASLAQKNLSKPKRATLSSILRSHEEDVAAFELAIQALSARHAPCNE